MQTMNDDKWAAAREAAIEGTRRMEGKTIAVVLASTNELKIRFTDGSVMEIGCSVVQLPMSDVAELEFNFEDGNG